MRDPLSLETNRAGEQTGRQTGRQKVKEKKEEKKDNGSVRAQASDCAW